MNLEPYIDYAHWNYGLLNSKGRHFHTDASIFVLEEPKKSRDRWRLWHIHKSNPDRSKHIQATSDDPIFLIYYAATHDKDKMLNKHRTALEIRKDFENFKRESLLAIAQW